MRATVHGRVQMVGFRAWVIEAARGLRGTVGNRPDGTVEVIAEGPPPVLEQLVRRLHEGPGAARVERVEVERHPATGGLPPMRIA
ncbi:MAG: acylphosphatase [Candidatus Dormibacteria bacterium]